MKKVLFFTTLLGLMLLSSCGEDEKYLGKSECQLTVHTISYDSHEPIGNITVEVLGMGKTVKSNALGVANFTLPIGNYELKVTGEGYAGIIYSVDIEVDNGESDMPMVGNKKIDAPMFPLTGSLKGVVTIERNGEMSYQKDAKLRVIPNTYMYDVQFVTPIIATSGEGGAYSFENLPVGLNLYIYAEYIENNAFYSGSSSMYSPIYLRDKMTLTAPTIQLQKTRNVYGPDIIEMPKEKSADLKITFNSPVDVQKIVTGNIVVKDNSWNGNTVGISYSFSSDNKTLSIKTTDPDGWRVGTMNDYSYNITLPNTSGDVYAAEGYFGVTSSLSGDIPALNVTYDAASFILKWEKQENVEVYDIYVKKEGKSDYILLNNRTSDINNAENQEINVFGLLQSNYYNDYGVYYIKVVGRNSVKAGDLAAATATKIEYSTVLPPIVLSYDTSKKELTWTKLEKQNCQYIFYLKNGDYYNEMRTISDNGQASTTQALSINEIIPNYYHQGTYSIKVVAYYYNYYQEFKGNLDAAPAIEVAYVIR